MGYYSDFDLLYTMIEYMIKVQPDAVLWNYVEHLL